MSGEESDWFMFSAPAPQLAAFTPRIPAAGDRVLLLTSAFLLDNRNIVDKPRIIRMGARTPRCIMTGAAAA
jgi:hypothetical protein